jgi:hypothetical protein
MPTIENDQEHVPMAVSKHLCQPETRDILVSTTTTTSLVETTNKYNQVIKQGERASWSNRIVYLLSIIGFVVDLGRCFQYFTRIFLFIHR